MIKVLFCESMLDFLNKISKIEAKKKINHTAISADQVITLDCCIIMLYSMLCLFLL